jgi:hypothetical protein
MTQQSISDVYLHSTAITELQKDVLQFVVTAELAAMTSMIWSYGWRVGRLRNALEPGLEAIRKDVFEKDRNKNDPRIGEYFSKKFGAQLVATVEAGTVVLVHSLLDSVLTKLLRTCVLHNAASWEPRILKAATKEYSLEQAIQMNREVAFDKATDSYIRRLGRESVIEKNTLLFAEFTEEARTVSHGLLQPDATLLKRFDRLRNQIVHEDGLIKGQYTDALSDAEFILRHASALTSATGITLAVPQKDVSSQMSALGLEGVFTPIKESDLESI